MSILRIIKNIWYALTDNTTKVLDEEDYMEHRNNRVVFSSRSMIIHEIATINEELQATRNQLEALRNQIISLTPLPPVTYYPTSSSQPRQPTPIPASDPAAIQVPSYRVAFGGTTESSSQQSGLNSAERLNEEILHHALVASGVVRESTETSEVSSSDRGEDVRNINVSFKIANPPAQRTEDGENRNLEPAL